MAEKVSALAGKLAAASMLVDVPRLVTAYFVDKPDPSVSSQRVAFGTSGHRGSSFRQSFNEAHILAISQAICAYRLEKRISGPLYLGKDTHALSEPAAVTALEVFAANGVEVMVDEDGGYTPTPVISHAILTHNKGRTSGLADGIVISPSHNPPDEGGFKYNPPNGGPADVDVTGWIERYANGLLKDDLRGVRRIPYARARQRIDCAPPRLYRLLCRRPRQRREHGGDCRLGREDRDRSARAAPASTTGSRSSTATASMRRSSTRRSITPSAS